jgi:DNA-binding IclR family transcriptional regulator
MGARTPGINSIACPIRDWEGRVTAAINLSGPESRLGKALLLEYVPQLKEATLTISRQLGYRGPAD